MNNIIALILVGLSVGLSNFAASVAIGLGGVSGALRLRIALIFGLFETAMPIIGLLIGQAVASKLGGHANIIGGSLLVLTGLYLLLSTLRKTDEKEVKKAGMSSGQLLIAALALSIDNLVVGFSIGTRHVPLVLSAIIIGATSVALTLLGLELGNKLNNKAEEYSELLSGAILIIVGIAIIAKIM